VTPPCRRCGNALPLPKGDGRRRIYCGDTCRQAGHRVRRAHGPGWYKRQPWYPEWLEWQAEHAARLDYERKQRADAMRQAAEHARLVDALPAEARKAYDAARKREHDELQLSALNLEIATLALKYDDLLRATGHHLRLSQGRETPMGCRPGRHRCRGPGAVCQSALDAQQPDSSRRTSPGRRALPADHRQLPGGPMRLIRIRGRKLVSQPSPPPGGYGQCHATAASTGRRCRLDAGPNGYCGHFGHKPPRGPLAAA
jgi:hypothetical protein